MDKSEALQLIARLVFTCFMKVGIKFLTYVRKDLRCELSLSNNASSIFSIVLIGMKLVVATRLSTYDNVSFNPSSRWWKYYNKIC